MSPSLRIGAIVSIALGCSHPGSKDSAVEPDDSSGASKCVGDPRYFCDADWFRAFSMPPDAGTRWEMDEDFLLQGGSVPNIVVLHDGAGYLMVYTRGDQWGSRWYATSSDGIEWTPSTEALFPPGDFPAECQYWSTDSSELYLDDGSYRLIVEGYDQTTHTYSHCSALSTDGIAWVPEGEVFSAGAAEGGTSVWSTLRSPKDGDWYSWYNGDLLGDDNIRVARSTDGRRFAPYSKGGVLDANLVDADLVMLEGGGYRAFLLHSFDQVLMSADATDEVTFGEPILPDGLNEPGCVSGECPRACRFDPSFLRLPDGSLWLYFGEFDVDDTCKPSTSGIRRARAVD